MPARYKNIFLAAIVIFFGLGMSELMKILSTRFHINLTVSLFLTLIPGLAVIYFVGKKLRLGEDTDNPPDDKE